MCLPKCKVIITMEPLNKLLFCRFDEKKSKKASSEKGTLDQSPANSLTTNVASPPDSSDECSHWVSL